MPGGRQVYRQAGSSRQGGRQTASQVVAGSSRQGGRQTVSQVVAGSSGQGGRQTVSQVGSSRHSAPPRMTVGLHTLVPAGLQLVPRPSGRGLP